MTTRTKLIIGVCSIAAIAGIVFLTRYARREPTLSSQELPAATSKELPNAPSDKIEHAMTMTDNGYSPSSLTIHAGDTVRFINAGHDDRWPASNIHPTHEIYPAFDPRKPVISGASWTFRFDREGKWYYHDHLDPSIHGLITVE